MASYGAGSIDEEEDGEIFSYKYGEDFPEALAIIGAAVVGGRPVNRTLGPLQQMKIIVAAGEYRAATPRRPGKGKPLPRSEAEKDMEFEARTSAQKACQRLILPKSKGESADVFIRRLDAHRQAPEALIAPLMAPEDDLLLAKRMVAVKGNENPNVLVLPKSSRETEHEFEERLDVCKKGSCALVFPRGAHESGPQFKTRLTNQLKARRPILPKSADEPEKGFAERCKLQLLAERVVHPYDSSREDEHLYFRRLNAHRERTALAFEPGDKAALNSALGPEKKPQEDEGRERAATSETAAELMRKAEEEAKARREEEVKAADADAEKLRLEKAAEEAAAMEEERVAQRIADMKAKAKEAQQAAEAELERKKSFSTEQININAIGFMPLKKLLMERGVPKDQVFACANKFALQEVAKKWADELKIEWVTE